jgi:signal transduction histidine kinase
MTATVAHDLGTPLNSVLGYAQLLAQENLSDRARRRLTIIETQIHRMSDIIQNYLSFSHGNPPRDKLDINEIIRDTLLLLQPVFKQRQVQVSTVLANALPAIYGDGNSIQRVLINLLDNAADACDKGGALKCPASKVQERRQRARRGHQTYRYGRGHPAGNVTEGF